MSLTKPKVSILMPVYNSEKYLREAIESILNQTFTDFEFIIILDPSGDNSQALIESYPDQRIILLKNDERMGLPRSLNRGLQVARGEFVARMDADDISMPERLAQQLDFMNKHSDIGLCGTWIKYFGEKNLVLAFPTDDATIRCKLLFENNLAHPSVMIRKNILVENNLFYDPAFIEVEDYDLWRRCSAYMSFANLGEILLLYRLHPEQAGKSDFARQQKFAGRVRLEELKNLGIDATAEEFAFHEAITLYQIQVNEVFLEKIRQWFYRIRDANSKSNYYSNPVLWDILNNRWLDICRIFKINQPPL